MMVGPEFPKKSDAQQVTQREVMLRIVQECGGDQERAVQAYAAAERRGDAKRTRNRSNHSPEKYARALLLDGLAKGWLPRYSTHHGNTEAGGRDGRLSTSTVRQVQESDGLKELRWKLIQLLNRIDRQRVPGENIRRRIGRLSHNDSPCLLYTSPSPRDRTRSRMPSSA